MIELNSFLNMDCMDGMAQFPDKYFELAIVDPPYGIKDKIISGGETNRKVKIQKGLEKFNDEVPKKEYFDELFRVSKNQIIWGGNYFTQSLSHSRGWIVWDKKIAEGMSFAMCEMAYTSFNTNAKIYRHVSEKSIHPCEKPVKLYEWVLTHYAHQGDKILDTHVGSASSLIACHNLHFDYIGFELDPDYYRQAYDRLESAKSQMKLL